jgi:glycosyltransferase involved in cell wall biosynthesis
MNILQVCPWLAESPNDTASGVSKAAYNVSRGLAKRGHDVTLCASAVNTANKRNDTDLARSEHLEIMRFPYVLHYGTFFVTPGLVSYLRDNLADFDIIHIHDFRHFQAIAAHHYARKYHIPYVLQAHGGALPLGKTGRKFLFDVVWGKRLINDADLLLALTSQEMDQYGAIGVARHKSKLLPNGIDLSEFIDLPPKGEFRKKFGIHANAQIILFLGRIHRIKGLDLLIDAFNLLRRHLSDVILVVVGPGDDSPDNDDSAAVLQRRVIKLGLSGKVIFTGPLYQRDKLEAYVDADVYVLPSRYEALPFTVLEAWACGTPVVVTDRCGIAERVKEAGFVVEFNAGKLCRTLLSVLKDEDQRKQASKLGQELVRREFSWDYVIDLLETFYRANSKDKRSA